MNRLSTPRYSGRRIIEERRDHEELRLAMKQKLECYDFTHFITLASHGALIGHQRMRHLLKQWDARVNRALVGPRWRDRPDERLVWFAFPEKTQVNPHWHLLAEIDPTDNASNASSKAARAANLPSMGEKAWLDLLPKGSFDCQAIVSRHVIDHVSKDIRDPRNFEQFIVCREFMP